MRIQDYQTHRNRKRAHRRQRLIIIGLCVLLCVICVILGSILLKNIFSGDPKPTVNGSSSTGSYETTQPSATISATVTTIAESGITEAERSVLLAQLEKDIEQYLTAKSGRFSVYYINMKNGEIASFNEDKPMVAASSIKIAYNTYLYKKAAEGTFSMDDKMTYNSAAYPNGDYEAGTGTIQNSANGTEYSIREVSRLSIRISDNCATNMVLRKLGGIDTVNDGFMVPISSVINYRSSVSYTDYTGVGQSGRHRTSAKDLAKYAAELYTLYSSFPDAYSCLIDDMCNTDFAWGIPAGLPSGTRVAHKVGFNTAYATHNDVGIVFGKEDYVLCVMTETGSAENAKTYIAEISRMIGDYIEACHPNG